MREWRREKGSEGRKEWMRDGVREESGEKERGRGREERKEGSK